MTIPLRLLLNSPFSGANAFFALAEQRGLFRAAGLDLQFTSGHGAYTAAARLANEGFDAAYGDLNALIELAAQRPQDELPIAVFVAHRFAPSCITVARDSPVRHPLDLAGCKSIGHASDVALRTFGAYARSAGLDPGSVQIEAVDAPMADLLSAMLAGKADAVFGYTTTHTAALAGLGLSAVPGRSQTSSHRSPQGVGTPVSADELLRFLPFRDVCPDLYGSALMVAPKFLRAQPDAVSALVGATRAGIVAARQAPDEAITAVLARSPAADRAIELQRWLGTLHRDIGWPAGDPTPVPPLGDVSDPRLAAAIASLAAANGWRDPPEPAKVFTRRFLGG